MNEITINIILFFSGIAMAFINMMAGGGGVIGLGTMLLLGVDPQLANGTYRIAVACSTGSGTLSFVSEDMFDPKTGLKLAAAAVPGAILGAAVSLELDQAILNRILAVLLPVVAASLFLPRKEKKTARCTRKWLYPLMFFMGLYAGFIQVGVGILLMATLKYCTQLPLLKINMNKVFVVFIITLPVIAVFAYNNAINWIYAASLSTGAMIGAWASVKLAIKKGDKLVKWVLLTATCLIAVKLLVSG